VQLPAILPPVRGGEARLDGSAWTCAQGGSRNGSQCRLRHTTPAGIYTQVRKREHSRSGFGPHQGEGSSAQHDPRGRTCCAVPAGLRDVASTASTKTKPGAVGLDDPVPPRGEELMRRSRIAS
jgi:hypothetical protein